MIMIDSDNLVSVLGKKGIKICGGLSGRKCWKPRRDKGRLCVECHREYMRGYMAKQRGSGRVRVVDDYDFNQEVR